MDLVYIGIGVAFFVLSWGLIRLCDMLWTDDGGKRS
jgi:hypothetical protein